MLKLLTVIGARPQIIKAAALSRAIAKWNTEHEDCPVREVILHTGQHYDTNMSDVFFRELGIPQPDINLHVGSGSHGEQTAKMIEGIEAVLMGRRLNDESLKFKVESLKLKDFDGVILYGDTNSTLAGAVAASKLHVPVFHIEAGLRSFNMAMPEEVNRIVCDQLSTILFAPTQTAVTNLCAEGFKVMGDEAHSGIRHFADGSTQQVILSGDVMYDNSMYFAGMAAGKSDVMQRLGLTDKQFVLATIHRPANTDNADNLNNIFRALTDIAEKEQVKVVLPLHPRTRKMLPQQLTPELLKRIENLPEFVITEPAGFFDIIELERHARIVMTDSGGVQKESFFFETPCVILRPETEWVEIVEARAGIIADADYERIMAAYKELCGKEVHFPQLFGDSHAAEKIIAEIIQHIKI